LNNNAADASKKADSVLSFVAVSAEREVQQIVELGG
jgi:hypothetical protein